jgi:hypothetical protein
MDVHMTDAGISVYLRWHQQCVKVRTSVKCYVTSVDDAMDTSIG